MNALAFSFASLNFKTGNKKLDLTQTYIIRIFFLFGNGNSKEKEKYT
jgi:hypothetical protein